MKFKPRPQHGTIRTRRVFAWLPVLCVDTRRRVWLEHVYQTEQWMSGRRHTGDDCYGVWLGHCHEDPDWKDSNRRMEEAFRAGVVIANPRHQGTA